MKRECYGVNWGLWNVQIHQHLRAKQSKNRQKSKRHAKENRTTGENTGHHGRGAHHGLTVAATTARGVHHGLAVVATMVVARLFSPVRRVLVFRCFALGRGFCLFLGLLGLFASFF